MGVPINTTDIHPARKPTLGGTVPLDLKVGQRVKILAGDSHAGAVGVVKEVLPEHVRVEIQIPTHGKDGKPVTLTLCPKIRNHSGNLEVVKE